jgi:nicotinate-nucleotide adenylyltransferase
MRTRSRVGVLGGTLDPIHLGHVEAALAARRALDLERVIVMPSRIPPHRQQRPTASPFHRFAMAALAINDVDGLVISDEELCAAGTSYTAETLERLHARGLAATQIFFITGADAFAEIETWHRYPAVLDLAHFVVVSRPGFPVSGLPERVPSLQPRLLSAGDRAAAESRPGIFLVDARTPSVSSTEIRGRLARGERLTGLVAPAVDAHIRRHGLYSRNLENGGVSDEAVRAHQATAEHLHGQD